MAETIPKGLTAAHLFQAVLPAEPDAADDTAETLLPQRRALYELSLVRLSDRVALNEAWRDRIRLDPPPAAPATLQELIAAARDRLRQDRLRDDVEELDSRRFVLRRVLDRLQP
jgi:hypothetical protein